MKPFDLEKALAGEPVVTRHGQPVTQVTKFDANSGYCIAAVVDGEIETFSLDGKFRIEDTSRYDLFMATKTVKKEGWVVLYKNIDNDVQALPLIYTSKEEARDMIGSNYRIATVKIEWEEEI